MQHAIVIPLHKNDVPAMVSNYRLLSLLSVVSKITEKLMYKRLRYKFSELHKILFGFCATHSINHALIRPANSIKNTLGNDNFGLAFLLTYKSF